ncbi:TOBE domain-containing protein, partial [Escherichia coli]|nr:TOBE domain-containing protein [Escherichia coli]
KLKAFRNPQPSWGFSVHNNISAKISVAELTGAEFMLYTTVGGHELVVRAGALNDYHAGENITIHFDMTKCHFFDAETEIAIC